MAESCTGSSGACPIDAKSTAVCRASAGACDLPESCDGVNDNCPADAVQPSGFVCRAPVGICDVPVTCNGTSPSCPTDAFQPSSFECRPATGPCDAAENCTGSGPDCPADAFKPSTTVCRPAAGQCDVEEKCTGTSTLCPADQFQPSTASCDDGLFCTVDDHCTGTDPVLCVGTTRSCNDNNVCSTDVCNEVTATCDHTSSVPPCEGNMTGGGQIHVDSRSDKRSFGFNAKGTALVPLGFPGGPSGHFNYLNHLSGAHIDGAVTFIYYAIPNGNGGEMSFEVTTLAVQVQRHRERPGPAWQQAAVRLPDGSIRAGVRNVPDGEHGRAAAARYREHPMAQPVTWGGQGGYTR